MKLSYDVLKDFTPITLAASVPHVLVVGSGSPVVTMRDLVGQAKAQPGKLNFSSSGIGATQHLAGELLNDMAKIDTVHVPYKGDAPAITDMLGGITVKEDAMRAAARAGFATATDLADYLVHKGLAFRQAHEVVGKAVRHCVEKGTALEKRRAFNEVKNGLKKRLDILASMPLDKLDSLSLKEIHTKL